MTNEATHASAGVGRLLAVAMWVIPVAVVAAGWKGWLPPLASDHGAGIDTMLRYLMVCVASLLLIGHLAFGYFLWRCSGQSRPSFRLASPKRERILSLIPVFLMTIIAEGGVLVLGLPVWAKFYREAPADAITVELTAEQFAWNVRYPGTDGVFGRTAARLLSLDNPLGLDQDDPASHDDLLNVGLLVAPVNRPLRVRLHSKDVLHSLFLPFLRVKQDVVPGMSIQVWFVPTQVGDYEIACAELCGFGHYQMRGLLRVVTEEEYERQIAQMPTFQ